MDSPGHQVSVQSSTLRVLVIAVGLLPGFAANAQQAYPQPQAPGHRVAAISPLTQNILNLVASVPPELSAYAQLRLVETNAISLRTRKIELIESAFSLARQSPYPIRKVFAYGTVDSRAGFLSQSYDLKLDAVSLRAQAVEDMLAVNPGSARNLFEQMRPLKLESLSCSDVEVYDASAFYRAVGAIFTKGFNKDERERGLDADFLVSIMQEVSHPTEVEPAAELLVSLKLDPDLSVRAEEAFGRALSTISGDRRSFDQTQYLFMHDLFRITQNPAPGHKALLSGTRTYLVANYSGEACADSTAAPSHVRADGTIASSTNDPFLELDKLFARYGIAPIDFSKLAPSSHGDSAQNSRLYWTSQPAHQLATEVRSLKSSPSSMLSPEWQGRAEAFLKDLRGWTDSSTEPSEDDFYVEKSELYSSVVAAIPEQSPVFQEAVGDFAAFLATPPQSDAVRIFWLSNLHSLRVQMKTSEAGNALNAALQQTPNPSVAMWGYLGALKDLRSNAQLSPHAEP